ncbi:NUDIX domain-containing protein [Anaerocolumna sedimenticola]|uniref:NUDIX domain-containing protein n=1 Tax=Anaerocolumna sedimenticola TaxID=2696063 RepID=A0A6P1TRU0_9FIRM|nr:NUDIX domain-containing protein [Anaerocolumna sedimenticola]QHQ62962.1 NUDIX domain-containing protein [Anaerocolumna sedimenticola]
MKNNDVSINTVHGIFTYRAAALIINDDKLLVARHKNNPCYYAVGGAVKINETSEEAVVREVLEETGASMEIDRLVFVQERFFKYSGENHHEIVFFYFMKYRTDVNILENSYTDQGENETLHWLPISNLKQFNIVPDFLKYNLAGNLNDVKHIITKE